MTKTDFKKKFLNKIICSDVVHLLINNLMKRLTKRQIERQDFVDNQIFELMQKLLPSLKIMDWDIEIIGAVRDAIQKQIVDKQKLMSEARFYPYLKI